jgi:hypothetical protein
MSWTDDRLVGDGRIAVIFVEKSPKRGAKNRGYKTIRAERAGFEPTVGVTLRVFSKDVL